MRLARHFGFLLILPIAGCTDSNKSGGSDASASDASTLDAGAGSSENGRPKPHPSAPDDEALSDASPGPSTPHESDEDAGATVGPRPVPIDTERDTPTHVDLDASADEPAPNEDSPGDASMGDTPAGDASAGDAPSSESETDTASSDASVSQSSPDEGDASNNGPEEPSSFDVAADFSTEFNPTPTGFSYGWKASLTGDFTLFPAVLALAGSYAGVSDDDPRVVWQRSTSATDFVFVGYNPSDVSVSQVEPHTVYLHPGNDGEQTVVRWSCPRAGTYAIAASFVPRDATTSGVAIVLDNTLPELFGASVAVGSPASFDQSLMLEQGATLDFSVDYGENQNNGQDSTGFAVTITLQ